MSTLLPDLDFLYEVAQLHIFKSVTLRGKQTHQKGLLKQDEKEDVDGGEEKCNSRSEHLEIRTRIRLA